MDSFSDDEKEMEFYLKHRKLWYKWNHFFHTWDFLSKYNGELLSQAYDDYKASHKHRLFHKRQAPYLTLPAKHGNYVGLSIRDNLARIRLTEFRLVDALNWEACGQGKSPILKLQITPLGMDVVRKHRKHNLGWVVLPYFESANKLLPKEFIHLCRLMLMYYRREHDPHGLSDEDRISMYGRQSEK